MEISNTAFKNITNAISLFYRNTKYELELKYNSRSVERLNREGFTRLIQYLRTQGFKEKEHIETLDIIFMYNGSSYRVSITGKDNIQKYCMTNKVIPQMVGEVMSKRQVPSFSPIFIDDYNIKVDLKEEEVIKDPIVINEILLFLPSALKGFRYKKRFSYTPNANKFRYDCTIVKHSGKAGTDFLSNRRFSASHVFNAYDNFEVEVEALRPSSKTTDTQEFAKLLLKTGIQVYAVVNGVENIIPKSEKHNVLSNYIALWSGKQVKPIEFLSKAREYFIGPQPVTLELKNIVSDGLGIGTVLSDYTVTEKADGERYLLYVNEFGSVYLINNKLEVTSLGIKVQGANNSLFDGEYITKDSTGKSIKIFAMFDAYYYKGKDIKHLPLINDDESGDNNSSRLKTMDEFYNNNKDKFSKGVHLHVKKFHYGDDIFKINKTIIDMINAEAFIYRIDGLIYTPKFLPVGGHFLKDKPNHFGAWTKVMKWKPPHENTIDMLITSSKASEITVVNGDILNVYKLHVGYKPSRWEPISPKDFLENKEQYTENKQQNTRYIMKEFVPPDVLDRDISTVYCGKVCKNGDDIVNNSIIEFSYINDESIPFPLRWKPLRVRKDKTKPNDWSTAMNVWRSIQYPVTENIVTGTTLTNTKDLPQEDVYYKRNLNRDQFASVNMMNFHNYWNKFTFLLSKYTNKDTHLFDIACGQGGDLRRWLDCGIKTVYGIDKVKDNIENPVSGMYSRIISSQHPLIKETEYVFGTMDASHVIDSSYVKSLPHKDDVYIGNKILSHGPFDVVSCQFAIHYFFESEQILSNFVENVATFLKEGGFFIGTCLDGLRVKQKLKDISKNASISGKVDDRYLWNIQRLYDTNDDPTYGEKIKIYMESIGLELEEYLVNMSLLIECFKRYDIVPVDIRSFQDTYNEVIGIQDTKNINIYYLDAVKNLSDIEKEYSFLNNIFVFKKDTNKNTVSPQKKVVKKKVSKKST